MKVKVHWVIDGIAELEADSLEDAENIVNKKLSDFVKNNPDIVSNGHIAAILNKDWKPTSSYSCLTGNAQLAIIFNRFSRIDRPERQTAVNAIVKRLKQHQNMLSSNKGICGGLPSSFPIWGDYIPFTILNWSTKFLVDLLLDRIDSSKTP